MQPRKRIRREGGDVKTTVVLPDDVWRAAMIRALDEHSDFRSVLIAALRLYLKTAKK